MKSLKKQAPGTGPEIIAHGNASVYSAQLDLVSRLLGNVVPVFSTWGSWGSKGPKEMLAAVSPREG